MKFLNAIVIYKTNSSLHANGHSYLLRFSGCSSYLCAMIDENAIDADGNSLETLLKIFLTLVRRFTLLVISLVPT